MLTITYEPTAGQHLTQAVAEAIQLCPITARGARVVFSFNGVQMIAGKADTPQSLTKLYDSITAKRSARWNASPEGIAAAQERQQEIERCQAIVTNAMQLLPRLLALKEQDLAPQTRMDALMGWLDSWVLAADDVSVDLDKEWLSLQLIAAGYRESEHVGESPEFFSTRDRLGRYIMGQVIHCLRSDMPPHPVSVKFIGDYFDLSRTYRKGDV